MANQRKHKIRVILAELKGKGAPPPPVKKLIKKKPQEILDTFFDEDMLETLSQSNDRKKLEHILSQRLLGKKGK